MRLKTTISFLILILISISLKAQTVDEIWAFYNGKDYENTIKSGQKILLTDPENPQVNLAIGRAFCDIGKHKEAIPYLIKATNEENNAPWVRAWSFGYMGKCYYIMDDFLESKKSFYECNRLNATKNSTQFAQNFINALQMNEFYDSWVIIEKENLRFHFQDKSKIKNIESFMKNRENAYKEINMFFNASPFKKIEFFIWDDPGEAKKILGQELGFANSRNCIINSRNNQTRGHEITHILIDFGIQPVQKTKLINEGTAVYFDQSNRNRLKIAKESLDGNKIDIIDLWNNPEKYPGEYNYAIGGALIEFLKEKGNDSQLKKLIKNQTTDNASGFYDNFNELIAEFEMKLKR